jgi:hypothetical protein
MEVLELLLSKGANVNAYDMVPSFYCCFTLSHSSASPPLRYPRCVVGIDSVDVCPGIRGERGDGEAPSYHGRQSQRDRWGPFFSSPNCHARALVPPACYLYAPPTKDSL